MSVKQGGSIRNHLVDIAPSTLKRLENCPVSTWAKLQVHPDDEKPMTHPQFLCDSWELMFATKTQRVGGTKPLVNVNLLRVDASLQYAEESHGRA